MSWLQRFHPATEAPARLVCLPHAGGSASYYFPVSRALAPRVDVVAVQYPGRQERRHEPAIGSLDRLADEVAAEVAPLADRPLHVFGHSLGALVGFEVARRLERDGAAVATLFASGRRAPDTLRGGARVHQLDDAGVLAEVRALAGTDTRLLDDDEVVRLVLPAIRSDYRAAETYSYRAGPPLQCPVVALVGRDDDKVTDAEARAWAHQTAGGFELRTFPGGHFYLNDQVDEVIAVVARRIAAIAPATTPVKAPARSTGRDGTRSGGPTAP